MNCHKKSFRGRTIKINEKLKAIYWIIRIILI